MPVLEERINRRSYKDPILMPGFPVQFHDKRDKCGSRHQYRSRVNVRLMLHKIPVRPSPVLRLIGLNHTASAHYPVHDTPCRQNVLAAECRIVHTEMTAFMDNRELLKPVILADYRLVNDDRTSGEKLTNKSSVFSNHNHGVFKDCDTVDLHARNRIPDVLYIYRGIKVAFHKMERVDLAGCLQQFWLVIPDLGLSIRHDLKVADDGGAVIFPVRAVEFNHLRPPLF